MQPLACIAPGYSNRQKAKWPACMLQCSRMLQCSSKKTSLPQHTVSVSPLCLFAFVCSQSTVRHTNLVGCCRRSTDGKWRQQRLGSRLCMILGWSIFGVGNLLRFAAMRFAAQMVLSGLGSLQFVMIPVVSNFLLGDKYTWEAFVSIVIILGGAKLCLMAAWLVCLLAASRQSKDAACHSGIVHGHICNSHTFSLFFSLFSLCMHSRHLDYTLRSPRRLAAEITGCNTSTHGLVSCHNSCSSEPSLLV